MSLKHATLDFSGCQNLHELHTRIKEALHFPDYYGMNLDAFWDCLNTDCDITSLSVVGSNTVADELKDTIKVILDMLEENKKDWADCDVPFDYEIIR